MSSSKLERQLNLMAALLETDNPLTAAEVHRLVPGYPDAKPSFQRAFERDKDELREMGIPVEIEEVPFSNPPQQGYRIPRDQYYLRDPGLEADELAALHFAASAVQLEGMEGSGGLLKLGGDGSVGGSAPSEVALPTHAALGPLFSAVSERRRATFTYNAVTRTLDPYRLDFLRGHWYLTGFDHHRQDERSFRVERIEGEVEVGPAKAFRRPAAHVPGVRLHPWQLGEGDAVHARVLVDADQVPMAVQYAGEETVAERRSDGSVVLEMAVTNRAGFRSFVLGFLEHAEVLSPPELRAEIVDWLGAIV